MAGIVSIKQDRSRITVEPGSSTTAQFTVTNSYTDRQLRVGARICPDQPGVLTWFTDFDRQNHEWELAPSATEQVAVPISIPQNAPAGSYPFHLQVYSIARPDEDFKDGEPVVVEVPQAALPPPEPRRPFPWWILIIGIVLISGVITAVVMLSGGTVAVPAVSGKPLDEVRTTLTDLGLIVAEREEETSSLGARLVLRTEPAEGTELSEGAPVVVVVAKAPGIPLLPSIGGTWLNVDTGTASLTKVEIQQNGDQVSVHAWGKCSPTDCDWDTRSGIMTVSGATVSFDQGFAVRTMKLNGIGDELVVVVNSQYRDGRAPSQTTDTFRRRFRPWLLERLRSGSMLERITR